MSFVESRPCRFDLKNEFNEFHCDPDVGDWSKVSNKVKCAQPPKKVVDQGAINNPVHLRERKSAQLGSNRDPELKIKAHVQHLQKWAPVQRNTHRDAAPGWCVARDLGTQIAENNKNVGCGIQKSNYWTPGATPINPTGQIQVGWWGQPARTMRPFYKGVKYSIYGRQPRTPWMGRNGMARSHGLRAEPVKPNPKRVKRKVTRFQGLHGSSNGKKTFTLRSGHHIGQGSNEKTARTQMKYQRPASVNGNRMGGKGPTAGGLHQPSGLGSIAPCRRATPHMKQGGMGGHAARHSGLEQPQGVGQLGPRRHASALLAQDRCTYSRPRGFRPCGIKVSKQAAKKMAAPADDRKTKMKTCKAKKTQEDEFTRVKNSESFDRCKDTDGEFEDPAYAAHRMAQQQLFDEFNAIQSEEWIKKVVAESGGDGGGEPVVKGPRNTEKINGIPKPRNIIPVMKPQVVQNKEEEGECSVDFDGDQIYTRHRVKPAHTILTGNEPKALSPQFQLYGQARCRGKNPQNRFSTQELPHQVCKLPLNGILPQRCSDQSESFGSGGKRATTRKRVQTIERTFNERETGLSGKLKLEQKFHYGDARGRIKHDRVQHVQYLPEYHLKLDNTQQRDPLDRCWTFIK